MMDENLIANFDLTDDENSEETVDLVEVDLNKELKEKSIKDMEYPCVVIDGVSTEQEFDFFKRRTKKREGATLPLFCFVEGVSVRLGDIALDLDTFLAIREISDYKVFVYPAEGVKRKIELNDPEALIKFINFKGGN